MDSFLIDIPAPSMGATVSELTVIDMEVAVGERFFKGQKVAELESDKSVFDYEAPCDGVVKEVHCRAGDIIPSGAPFLRVETADESLRHLVVDEEARSEQESGSGKMLSERDERKSSGGGKRRSEAGQVELPASAPVRPVPSRNGEVKWTPRAIKIAKEAGFEPSALSGVRMTGPG
ncbi:MAG: biotin/lipoyl-containing protein, partial [Opitutales bacterium]